MRYPFCCNVTFLFVPIIIFYFFFPFRSEPPRFLFNIDIRSVSNLFVYLFYVKMLSKCYFMQMVDMLSVMQTSVCFMRFMNLQWFFRNHKSMHLMTDSGTSPHIPVFPVVGASFSFFFSPHFLSLSESRFHGIS